MSPAVKDAQRKSGDMKMDEAARRGTLMVVFVGLVVDLLAFTMILPLLPALLDYYSDHDKGGLYGSLQQMVSGFRGMLGAPDTPRWNTVLFGGFIGSLFSLLQFIASPIIGAASDVYGRKPIMIMSMIGVAASYLLWALSGNFTIFVIARIVGGISKGNVGLSTAIVADICPAEKRGKGMALIGIAFSVGFIIGPLIGAFFSRQARSHEGQFFVAPALLALLLALLDIVFFILFLKETLPANKRTVSMSRGLQKVRLLLSPVSLFKFDAVTGLPAKDLKVVRQVGVVYFLYLFFYSGLEFTLTFLTHNRFNFDSIQQGKMFCVIGVTMGLIQGGFVRRLKPGKELRIIAMALVVLMPALFIVGFAREQWMLYCGLMMYAFSSATVVPLLTTIISSYGSMDQKGTLLGIFRSLGAFARAFGPLVASVVYWMAGAEICYVAGGVCILLPLYLLRKIKYVHKSD